MGSVRRVIMQFRCTIYETGTIWDWEGKDIFLCTEGKAEPEQGTNIIYSLTIALKIFLCGCVFLPRICIEGRLLWIGSLWLLATNDFEDLILNAVALAFINELGEVLYISMAPGRNKSKLRITKLLSL